MKCNACGKILFNSDTHCPDCGVLAQNQNHRRFKIVLWIIAGLTVIILLTKSKF